MPQMPSFRDTSRAGKFRQLAEARLLVQPSDTALSGSSPSDYDLNPGTEPDAAKLLVPAAVLVGIVARAEPTILLTERTAHLSAHGGQIAFPGGKIEAYDADPAAAAVREAHEETGIDPSLVSPIGYLESYRTATGFLITPLVASIAPDFALKPDPSEVADIFEVPLAFLMDAGNHRIDSRQWRGAKRRFYAMPYQQHYIWGATAGIIKALHRRLFTA
jgi:8-oxo-dGTP pyrophosphatase MutT (NUDIX family)